MSDRSPINPESLDAVNPAGDRDGSEGGVLGTTPIRVVCGGCTRVWRAAVLPNSPVVAKFKCRMCGYVTDVTTRDEVMDKIEGHIEEGEHDEKMKTRTTNSNGAENTILGPDGKPFYRKERRVRRLGNVGTKLDGKIARATVLEVE